ncbi:MAG: hypothetical protein ACI959_001282 [Limisphaerales bacterium]|jgi:hypothetical protein
MSNTGLINFKKGLSISTFPLLLIGAMLIISRTMLHNQTMVIALTLDFVITLPIVWYFSIRKTKIPKLTVVTAFILGMLLASFLIPKEEQYLLNQIKTFVFPLVELGVSGFVLYAARKTMLAYQKENTRKADFFSAIQSAAAQMMPAKIAGAFATEIAVFYYAFNFKKAAALQEFEFSYHKKNGIQILLYTFIFLAIIETGILHMLLIRWNPIVAWVLFGISTYSCLQLFALIRSIPKRPVVVNCSEKTVHLKYGIFGQSEIAFAKIDRFELTRRTAPEGSGIVSLSPLGPLSSHNLIIHLKEEATLSGIYGIKKQYKSITLYLDKPQTFSQTIEDQILTQ